MLGFAEVSIGTGGATECRGCALAQPPHYLPRAELSERIAGVVRDWRGGAGPNVAFTGPDAFAHPELPALVVAARELGVVRLRLDTDCSRLSAADARGALEAGVRHLRVTLLGDAETHDVALGRPGAARALAAGIGALMEASAAVGRAAVVARVPLCEHNIGAAPSAVVWAIELGCASVELQIAPSLRAEDAVPWVAAACDTGMMASRWVCVSGLPAEALGGHRLHAVTVVEPSGTVG